MSVLLDTHAHACKQIAAQPTARKEHRDDWTTPQTPGLRLASVLLAASPREPEAREPVEPFGFAAIVLSGCKTNNRLNADDEMTQTTKRPGGSPINPRHADRPHIRNPRRQARQPPRAQPPYQFRELDPQLDVVDEVGGVRHQ